MGVMYPHNPFLILEYEMKAIIEQTLQTIIDGYPTNDQTKNTLRNYIPNISLGLRVSALADFEDFNNSFVSEDLHDTYWDYRNRGVKFSDVITCLTIMIAVGEKIAKTKLLLVTFTNDTCGNEDYLCFSQEEVEETVFGIFTDWDRGEDTIDDIDNHLRENGVGSITVKEIENDQW